MFLYNLLLLSYWDNFCWGLDPPKALKNNLSETVSSPYFFFVIFVPRFYKILNLGRFSLNLHTIKHRLVYTKMLRLKHPYIEDLHAMSTLPKLSSKTVSSYSVILCLSFWRDHLTNFGFKKGRQICAKCCENRLRFLELYCTYTRKSDSCISRSSYLKMLCVSV